MHSEELVAVHRNHLGDIISFRTSEGRIISYRKALQEAESGLITGVSIAQNQSGLARLSPISNNDFDGYPTIY